MRIGMGFWVFFFFYDFIYILRRVFINVEIIDFYFVISECSKGDGFFILISFYISFLSLVWVCFFYVFF